jgi:non-specific serine/threonine protein kinase/serine/threonine-protein kinase
LKHPNIVAVHSTEIVDGQPVVVMEWLAGFPIDRWAAGATPQPIEESQGADGNANAGGRRAVREVVTAFAPVCDAVAHAHQRSIVHRDLKPSNILVDAAGQPHVLDFGLAASMESATRGGSDATRVMLTHAFVGTPAYAAPEQLHGDGQVVDTRSDVFSLGVVLYESLTGVWPFATADDRSPGASLAKVMDAIRTNEPRLPSTLRSDVGPELNAIVVKAIAKQPEDRYQSADALAADLRRFLAGDTVLAHPPSTLYQLRKLIRRHRLAFAAGAAIVALSVVFAIVSTTLAVGLSRRQEALVAAERQERRQRENAEAQRQAAEDAQRAAEAEVGKTRAMIHFFETFLFAEGRMAPLRPDVTIREMLDRAAEAVDDGRWRGQPAIEAAARTMLGRAYCNLGEWAVAEKQLRAALALRDTLRADDPRLRSITLCALARAVHGQAGLEESLELYREALALREQAVGPAHIEVIPVLWGLGEVLRDDRQFGEAETRLLRALDIALLFNRPDVTAESEYRLLQFYEAWLAVEPSDARRAALEEWRLGMTEGFAPPATDRRP